MAGVVFFFEEYDTDTWSGRPADLDAWRYAIKAGGIEKAVCFNTSNIQVRFDSGFDFTLYTSFEEYKKWVDDNKDSNLVFIDTKWTSPGAAIPLGELDHGRVDWYIFGAAGGIPYKLGDKIDVYLPQCGIGALHSVHIATAVLLRRWEEVGTWQ